MAMLNAKLTMKALVKNTLDIRTGKSKYTTIKDLEKSTGLRQVSNGGKIIRDDNLPFNKFNIQRDYDPDTRQMVGVTFNGYRTVGDQRKVVAARIQTRKSKIESLEKLLKEDIQELLHLYDKIGEVGEDSQLFSEKDISPTFLE